MRTREWPGRVVPAGPGETEAAIRSLFARASWFDPISGEVIQELRKWFDAEWCVDAILIALDHRPDNSRQVPRGARDQDLARYLRNRLTAWFNDNDSADSSSVRLAPPRPGMTMATWWRVSQRNRENSGVRRPQQLGPAGERARQQARALAASKRPDRVTRVREKDAVLRAAMDRLLPPGVTDAAAAPLVEPGVTAHPPRHRLEAGYAGRRSIVEQNDTVREISARLVAQRRRPTPVEIVILRNAMKGSRVTASLAELEALSGGDGGALSPEAMRILSYYEHAVTDNLSLDSMSAVLTAMVDDEP
jgi:hypothetical protein